MNLIFWIGVICIIVNTISEAISDKKKEKEKKKTDDLRNIMRDYPSSFTNKSNVSDSYNFGASTLNENTVIVKSKTPVSKSRYNRIAPREYISRKREKFEEMKKTDFFHDWKIEQYRCQHGKCAYCRRVIDLHSPDTQVDHVKPFCHYGNNCYDNFVLACKECNYELKKGDYIWTDANGAIHEGWNKPEWIEENQVLNRVKKNKEKETFVSSYSDIPF